LPRTSLLAYFHSEFILGAGPMRVLYLYCHPLPESFHAAIRVQAIAGLEAAGHEVDLIDLYADGFNPVLSEDARRHYHDTSRNQAGLEGYIERLQSADALVVQFPVWCFGMPAMLKGFIDRMFMPGVAFDISNPTRVTPLLGNLKRIAGIATYGRPRWMAFTMGDPPRKIVKRYLRWFADRRVRVDYHALYHMNVASEAQRAAFMEKVRAAMTRLG
jgi:NAD(P)H dehydrogenase (quinone)